LSKESRESVVAGSICGGVETAVAKGLILILFIRLSRFD